MSITAAKKLIRRILPSPPVSQLVDIELMVRYVARSLKPDAFFIEVGSFTGLSGRAISELAGLNPARCHLIEACPVKFALLKEHCPGFRAHNVAIGGQNGFLPFYVVDTPRDEGTSRSNTFDRYALEKRFGAEQVKEIRVRTLTMDGFLLENQITRPDFLFFNCEGAEFDIFRGSLDFLTNVQFLYLDLHHREGDRVSLKQEQKAIYDRIVSTGFTRVGGHKREDIDNHMYHVSLLFERSTDVRPF